MSNRFHLDSNIEEIKKVFESEEGKWQDINFWGNELTLHDERKHRYGKAARVKVFLDKPYLENKKLFSKLDWLDR